MGTKRTSGLLLRGGVWHINKQVQGKRLRESTGTASYREAQLILAKRIDEIRRAVVFGERVQKSFHEAVGYYFTREEFRKLKPATRKDYIETLEGLDSYIGDLPLEKVTMQSMDKYMADRRKAGVTVRRKNEHGEIVRVRIRDHSNRTLNKGYECVRRILTLATEWRDEYNQPWLDRVPVIKVLNKKETQKPARPISWSEQDKLFVRLPEHMKNPILFLVNVGIREANIRRLQWEWEVKLKCAENRSIFVIPKGLVKNNEPRLVVLNDVAQAVVEEQRGKHPTHVFTYKGNPILSNLCNTAWKNARADERVNMSDLRVHDMKHTFGLRLRAAGVSFEDRQDLLGHKSSRITTEYSVAKIQSLIDAANKAAIRPEEEDDLAMSIREILAMAA